MSRDPEEVWSREYDSTWEEEGEDNQGPSEPGSQQKQNFRKWMSRAARDLQNYRHGYVRDKSYQYYPSQPSQTPNLDFYQDKRRFEPDGLCIEQLLTEWKKKYDILERNHSYIQWLFPLREYGMNSCAKPLTKAEIEAMKKDKSVRRRFLEAYKLMLDFYGIELEDEKSGKVKRTENWEARFRNLNDHSHNNLRITRILKCLGELGFEHYQFPLVKFFLQETLCNDQIQNVKRSALDYFMFTVKNKKDRRKLVHFAWENYKQGKFIWGPVDKLRAYQPPTEDEHETTNCHNEKNDESDEEAKMNGQLETFENISDNEELKGGSDSISGKNVLHLPNKEFIALKSRVKCGKDLQEKPLDEESKSTEVLSDKSLFSSHDINGGQHATEEADRESSVEEANQVSPKHVNKVPSAVEHQEEGNIEAYHLDGTGSSNETNSLPQDKINNVPTETPRKRKMENGREGTPNRGPAQPDDHSELPKEGGEGIHIVGDKVKKLKLIEQPPGSAKNIKVPDDPLSGTIGKDPQQSAEGIDLIEEEVGCNQSEEIPKLNKQSFFEKKEDDPTVIEDNEDSK